MIPRILGPNVRIFSQESDRYVGAQHKRNDYPGHLEPNGGFSALMSCTDDVSFGILVVMLIIQDVLATRMTA